MNLVILIAGIAGLAIALFGFVALTRDAARHRQWLDVLLAAALVVAVVWFLIAYGDRILR